MVPFVAESGTGRSAGEVPVYGDSHTVHPAAPSFSLAAQGVDAGNSTSAQALPSEEADLDLGLIEPAAVLGCVVDRQTVPDLAPVIRAEVVGERLPAVSENLPITGLDRIRATP